MLDDLKMNALMAVFSGSVIESAVRGGAPPAIEAVMAALEKMPDLRPGESGGFVVMVKPGEQKRLMVIRVALDADGNVSRGIEAYDVLSFVQTADIAGAVAALKEQNRLQKQLMDVLEKMKAMGFETESPKYQALKRQEAELTLRIAQTKVSLVPPPVEDGTQMTQMKLITSDTTSPEPRPS